VEPVPRGIATPDEYLSAVLTIRKQTDSAMTEESRSEALVGQMPARKMITKWKGRGGRFRGSTLAWRDDDRFFMLAAWVSDSGVRESTAALDAAEGMVSFLPRGGATVAPAAKDPRIDQLVAAVPHLSRNAVAMLIKSGGSRELTAGDAFRTGHLYASRGI